MKRKQAYPRYKPSGIEWLGDVPEHWETVSLKWASVLYSGGTPDKTVQEYWEDGTIPWLNSGAVNDRYITEPSEYITAEAFRNSSAKWIPKDSLVIALAGQGKTKGMVAQVGLKITCNQSMAVIIPNKKFYARFLFWWITKNYSNLRNLAGGDARDGLNLEMIGSISCPLPFLPEQQSIAAFLDRETGRIDTLLAKKERLIELLREKRSALISYAVTKGIDPSVKLKPSGVEWLGDVPEHWEVKRLKHLFSIWGRIGYRGYTTEDLVDEGQGALALGATHITDKGSVDPSEPVFITWQKYYESPEIMVYKNDLIVVQRGSCGKVALVDFDLGPATINPSLILLKNAKAFQKFVLYVLLSGYIQSRIATLLSSTAVPMLSQEQVANFTVILPPLIEQQAIAIFLDRETGKIDSLIAKVEAAIAKLKEYRTALISAAVTGKIDIREAA